MEHSVMSTTVSAPSGSRASRIDHLDQLEHRSVHLLREAYASFPHLAMLWSIGKDSTVLLWLARKAFFGHVPMPLVHIDTSYKIPEMIQYRDRLAAEWRLTVIYGQNEEALAAKQTFPDGNVDRLTCCGNLKTEALRRTLSGEGKRYRFDHTLGKYVVDTNTEPYTGVIVGARADEEGSRSKERYFSPRSVRTTGTSPISRPSSGTSTRRSSRRARTCASIRCSIGRSSTSGSTSSVSAFRPSASTTTRARASGIARSAAGHAPSRSRRTRGTCRRSSSS
jgi:3'-phosphoadenosine 5'-phosphosulfate sulfotransferase (PAPS reductase)/FAD synthetase